MAEPVICSICQGLGYLLHDGGPGCFDGCGCWQPTELREVCEGCGGVGFVNSEAKLCCVELSTSSEPDDSDYPF